MIIELLFCALLISFTVTLSLLFLGRFGPLYTSFWYGMIVILWGWLGPAIKILPQILMASMTLMATFLILKNRKIISTLKNKFRQNFLQILFVNTLLIIPAFLVNAASSSMLLRIASLGYDNYNHIGFFYRTFFIDGFEYSPFATQSIINSLSMQGYPLLQTSSWTFLLKLTGSDLGNTEQLLHFFYLFEIYTVMFLVYILLLTFFKGVSNGNSNSFKNTSLFVLVGIIAVIFSPIMTLIWQGLPPTFFGLLAVYGTFLILTTKLKLSYKFFYVTTGVILTGYSYQLFVPVALVPLIFLFLQDFKLEKRNFWIAKLLISFLFLCGFATPLVLASQSIPSYLFHFGGIEPPKIYLLVSLLLLTLFTFRKNRFTLVFHTGFYVAIILGSALTTYAYLTKTGMYYPIKLFYLALALGTGALLQTTLMQNKKGLFSKPKSPLYFSPIFVFLFLTITSTFTPKYFTNSTTIDILQNHNFGSKCLESQLEEIRIANTFGKKNVLYLIKDQGSSSDVLTRWFNSLNGKNDDDVFNFAIPYGMANNQKLFLNDYIQKNPNFHFLIFEITNQDTCGLKLSDAD